MNETNAQNLIQKPVFFNHQTFFNAFVADLRRARALVLIKSPFLAMRKIYDFRKEIDACIRRGVRICVVAQEPKEESLHDRKARESSMRLLEELDVHITLSSGAHEKLAVIDEEVLWDGSMNILSFYDSKERMLRWISHDMLKQAIMGHELDLCAVCSARSPLPLFPPDDFTHIESMQVICKCIVRRRCELGLSQAELAQLTGMRVSVIKEIESGKRNLQHDTVFRIVQVLRMQLLPIPWHYLRTVYGLLNYNFKVEPAEPIRPAEPNAATPNAANGLSRNAPAL